MSGCHNDYDDNDDDDEYDDDKGYDDDEYDDDDDDDDDAGTMIVDNVWVSCYADVVTPHWLVHFVMEKKFQNNGRYLIVFTNFGQVVGMSVPSP